MTYPSITNHSALFSRFLLVVCNLAASVTTIAAETASPGPSSWPNCLTAAATDPQQLTNIPRVDIPAASVGCKLVFASTIADTGPTPAVLELSISALIAGQYDGSLGRPPAVHISDSAAEAADAVVAVPAGGVLLLQDLLLTDVTLTNPEQGNPNNALLPTNIQLPNAVALKLRDVIFVVTQQQLQQYVSYMLGIPQVTISTDNVSFLHIRNYTNPPFGVVEARGLTLIAPAGAEIDNTPLPVLQASKTAGAASSDGAGIVTVTDNYVLAATNKTLLPLMQRLAGREDSKQPLFVNLATNMTLSPTIWGPAWPAAGVVIRRPVIWSGSSWRTTSLDMGMDVGQIDLSHQYSNMTLMSVALENLAYGDEQSSEDAEGNSILLSNQLWAFKYQRSVPRLVLYDDVLVLPEQQQIENIIYWVNAFNSNLPFWRDQTSFLRDTLKYTVIQYTVGKVPGDYIIIKALKKDQRMYNLTYTTTPAAAQKLALPFNASIHQKLVEGQADPVVGTILSARGLAVTIWNQRRAACSRPHVLIPSPGPHAESAWVSWAPVRLDMPGATVDGNSSLPAYGSNNLQGNPLSMEAVGPSSAVEPFPFPANSSSNVNMSADDMLYPMWPPPGGEIIRCPLTIRGRSPTQPARIDLGFGKGMFKVETLSDNDLAASAPQGAQGLAAAAAASAQANSPGTLLQLSELTFIGLPQGGELTAADGHVDRAAAPAIGGGGGTPANTGNGGADAAWVSGWVSNLPAEAWTHLLWFIDRQFSNEILVGLSDITLMLPVPEAQQFAEAANSAYQAAGGDSAKAILSVLYPTADGPLPVSYRSISMNGSAAPAADNVTTGAAAAPGGRRLLQQAANRTAAAAGPGPLIHICVDSMIGLGLVGKNICFMELQNAGTLPPGYVWATGAVGGAAAWPAWKTVVVVLAVVLPVLAAVAVAAAVLDSRKRARRRQQQQHLAKVVTDSDAKAVVDSVPDSRNSTGSAPAAAAAAAATGGVTYDTAGSTKSYGSSLAHMLGQCCPRNSLETAGVAAAGTSGSSSMIVHTPQVAAAPPAAAAGVAAAAAAGSGESAGSEGSGLGGLVSASRQQSAWADPTFDPSMASSLYRGEGSSLVVNLGEQLGQLAAIHKRSIFQQDVDIRVFTSQGATIGEGETTLDQRMQALTEYQQQRQQQRGMLVITGDSHASTLQRLTNAISTVSAEMQLRKLGGVSTTTTGLSPQPSGASAGPSFAAAIAANRAAAAASGGSGLASLNKRPSRTESGSERGARSSSVAQQQQQQQQQGVKRLSLSIEEPEDPASVVAQAPVSTTADVAQRPGSHSRSPSLSGLLAPQVLAEDTPPQCGSPAVAAGSSPRGTDGKSSRALVASNSGLSSHSASGGQRHVAVAMGIQLQLHEVIGSGTFGVVYRATWRGIPAAVKVMQLSGSVIGCGGLGRGISEKQSSRREQMAVMETALGSSLSHPNIVQVYTYHIRPLHGVRVSDGDHRRSARLTSSISSIASSRSEGSDDEDDIGASGPKRKGSSSSSNASAVVGYELQLVMEYCALGSLREALDNGFLDDRLTSRPHYLTVLTLALGVARAMHHLHSEGVLHGDLKCGNVLLKMDIVGMDNSASGGGSGGGGVRIQGLGMQFKEQLTAKVADFGLATRLNDTETHVSGVHRGTLNHMSPELLVHGHASRASDVYAMGILLWEMATGGRAFSDVPKAMLGAAVVRDKARPEWPDGSSANQVVALVAATAAAAGTSTSGPDLLPPLAYRQLTEACWAHEAKDRPSFAEVSSTLEALLKQEQQKLASLAALTEATSAAQNAAAAASGYAATTTAEVERRALPAPPVAAAGAPAGAGQDLASRPADAVATAAAPSSATFQTIISSGMSLDSKPTAAAADVDVPCTAAGTPVAANAAADHCSGTTAPTGKQQQSPSRLSRKSPFEMLKDRSGW